MELDTEEDEDDEAMVKRIAPRATPQLSAAASQPQPEETAESAVEEQPEEVSKLFKSGTTPSRRLPDWLRLESVRLCDS